MTMGAAEIIEYLRNRNLIVSIVDEDSIELQPAEKVTRQLVELLRLHKPAIVLELKGEQSRKLELIAAWLSRIGEPAEDRDLVLDKCRVDPVAMIYFLKHAYGSS